MKAAAIALCIAAALSQPSERTALVLIIQGYKLSYALYEPVTVRCHVANPTSKTIKAIVELKDNPALVTFSVTGPDGVTRAYRGRGTDSKAAVEELQEPGMAKVAEIDLDWNDSAHDWAFPRPGKYRVVARLGVGNDPDPVTIESNAISIDVHDPWDMDAQLIESFATKDEFTRLLRDGAAVYCLPKAGPDCFEAIERRLTENPTSVYVPILAKDLAGAVAAGLIAVTPEQRRRAEQLEEPKRVTRETLTAMIRAAERARDSHRKSGAHHGLTFFEPFFGGDFYGGVFQFGATTPDPRRLESLIENFDYWDSTARASLLVDYARIKNAPSRSVRYEGISTLDAEQMRAREDNDRGRILSLVRAKGYAKSWNGFAKTYKRCGERAALGVSKYKAEHPKADVFELAQNVVDPIAIETGLHEAVERTRIVPEDVADEMLRIVRTHMAEAGLPEDTANLAPEQLFYGCEHQGRGTVNVLSWHPLAQAMYSALDPGASNPQAAEIRTAFDQLTDEFAAWLNDNLESDNFARDRKIRELGIRMGIFEHVKAYAAAR
jgi:hypothetical protein